MDLKSWTLFFSIGFCICVIGKCRPESPSSYSSRSSVTATALHLKQAKRLKSRSIDQMVFPESQEEELITSASMQMRRPLSPTPASSADCRQIKVFRAPNGTLGHRYVDCDNATSPVNAITPAENRFGENDTPVRVAGPTDQKTTQRETTARTMKVGEGADSRDSIVFPDTMNENGEMESDKPDCANGQPFCTEDSSYPQSTIEELLQRLGNLNDLLQSDAPEETSLANRVNGPGEETFCDYESRMEYPTRGLSRGEKWLPIVNHANYTQGIRMETCRNLDRPCKMSGIFPFNIKTKCVQKYQLRQLLALHEDGQLRREYFNMPTCCICTFTMM